MNENGVETQTSLETVTQASQPREGERKIERKNPLSAYLGSEYLSLLRNQEKEGRIPAALFTDIDNTFFRKDRAYPSEKLFKDLHQENYPMIAVTGNSFPAVEKRIQSGELPYFPIIAGSVGTEIYVLHEEDGKKAYKKDEAYEELMHAKGFDRLEIAKKGQQMVEDFGGKNTEYQELHPEWRIDFQQPDEERAYREGKVEAETQFKVSFNAFAASDASFEALKTEVSKRFPQQCVVFCESIDYNSQLQEGDTNKKYNIDILPTTKAGAIEHIGDTTGVGIKVVAGDSGNDLEMLMGGKGDVSIIVGGSKPELREVVHQNIFDSEINKDFKKIIDSNGKEGLYYLEIGTGRGPESIAKVFKEKVKIMQKMGQNKQA